MSTRRTSYSEAPLLVWGEALRRRRAHNRRLRGAAFALGVVVSAVNYTVLFPPLPRLVWNASSSAPVGLYHVIPTSPAMPIGRGDMVIARLAPPWRALAAARRYLPTNVPLVKRVAAQPGDTVCASGDTLSLGGKLLVRRLARDRMGRVLPWWQGCIRLRAGQYLLLMRDKPGSFDGRYFGITKSTEIVGQARLLWAR